MANNIDTEAFSLRRFVEGLPAAELEIIDATVKLSEIAARLDGNPKAVLFRNAGPESAELVGNVLGSRERLALALGVKQRDLMQTVSDRLAKPIAPVVITHAHAPVQEVVLEGDDADLTALPAHLQHDLDGAPYISATIDFSMDQTTGFTNIGMRRLMLRGRHQAGVDMQAPSDFKIIYGASHAKNATMPVAFVVGSHPADAIAAVSMAPAQDDFGLMGGLRGAPVPKVKCVTNDLYVPADAELVLEGYLHAEGWTEPEGPFGEYVGYYGKLKQNPVFHLTAITHRENMLFQTATIGGRYMENTDTAQICTLRTEATAWAALQTAVREPLAIYVTASCGGMYNARLSINQRVPGEARNAIAAVLGSMADIKHLFVVDGDIDIFSDAQIDWALATRFQADRDLVTSTGYRAVPLDPSLEGERTGAKAGFDLTLPFGKANSQEFTVPAPPMLKDRRNQTVETALADGPKCFRELMEWTGSDDGREIIRVLEGFYADGSLGRLEDGRYLRE